MYNFLIINFENISDYVMDLLYSHLEPLNAIKLDKFYNQLDDDQKYVLMKNAHMHPKKYQQMSHDILNWIKKRENK